MFIEMAKLISQRGTCGRARVGAIIVKDGRIISMGYNGAPSGMKHCTEVGCEHEQHGVTGCERAIHAEANAIAWAARAGTPPIGGGESAMYCTHAPCYTCAKLIISAGIAAVHYYFVYRDTRGVQVLDKANVIVQAHGIA